MYKELDTLSPDSLGGLYKTVCVWLCAIFKSSVQCQQRIHSKTTNGATAAFAHTTRAALLYTNDMLHSLQSSTKHTLAIWRSIQSDRFKISQLSPPLPVLPCSFSQTNIQASTCSIQLMGSSWFANHSPIFPRNRICREWRGRSLDANPWPCFAAFISTLNMSCLTELVAFYTNEIKGVKW